MDIFDSIITQINLNLPHRKQIVIVPDNLQLQTQSAILKKLNIQATFDVEVYTFSGLAGIVSGSHLPTLSRSGSVMLVDMILNQNYSQLKMFTNTAMSIPFAGVMYNTITTMQNCLITPEALAQFASHEDDPALKNKLLDISLIYKKYLHTIQGKYVDNAQILSNFPLFVQKNEKITYSDVYFYGFHHMSPVQYNILSSIIPCANSLTVGVLVADNGQSNAHIYASPFLDNLIMIANTQKVAYNMISAPKCLTDWQNQILDATFGYASQPIDVTQSPVAVLEASTPYTEVDFVAKDILRKIRTQGLRFADINISATNLPLYAPIIRNAFTSFDIPYYIDNPLRLTDTIGYQLISAVFDMILTNFDNQPVLSYIKNPILNIPKSTIYLIENTIKKFGLKNENFFHFIPELNNDKDYVNFHAQITQYLNPVFTFAQNIDHAQNITNYCQAVEQFLQNINFETNLNDLAKRAFVRSDLEKHGILKQINGKIQKILEQMLDVIPDFDTTFLEFTLIFNSTARGTKVSPLPKPLDCVYVSSTITGAFDTKHSTYILCATEGAMPSFVLDVGLITDSDIMKLKSSGIMLYPTVNLTNITNKSKLIQQLILSTQNLTLTYPMFNGDEKFFPSTAVLDLTNAFHWRGNSLPITNIDAMLSNDLAFGSTMDRMLFRWSNKVNALTALSLSQDNTHALPPQIASTIHQYLLDNGLSNVINTISLPPAPAQLNQNIATHLFFPKGRTKVTEIERYFQCPYMHFVEYGLKLRTPTISQIDSLTIGTLLHAVLEHFTIQMMNQTIAPNEIQPLAGNIFDEIISAPEYAYLRVSGQNQTILDSLRAESIRICLAIYHQQSHSRYKIEFVEASFGEDNFAPLPQIAITDTTKLAVRGKIDRVDRCGKRYRIIDYKTSKHAGTFNLLDFYLGKKIQLFYYAASLLRGLRLKDPECSIGGVFYLPLHREYTEQIQGAEYQTFKMDGVVLDSLDNLLDQDDTVCFDKPRSNIIPFGISTKKENVASDKMEVLKNKANVNSQEMQILLDYSEALVAQAITELMQGYILPKPIAKACDFCPYRSICKIQCESTPSVRSDEWSIEIKDFGDIKW